MFDIGDPLYQPGYVLVWVDNRFNINGNRYLKYPLRYTETLELLSGRGRGFHLQMTEYWMTLCFPVRTYRLQFVITRIDHTIGKWRNVDKLFWLNLGWRWVTERYLQEERAPFRIKIQKKNNRNLNIEKYISPYFNLWYPSLSPEKWNGE